MARHCQRDDCDGAVSIQEFSGNADGTGEAVELYECEYGHEFSVVLS